MNPVAVTIISPGKEYWPSRGSIHRPPVLKSATLPTELLGSELLTLFPNKVWFSRVCSTSLSKTLCEKEKLLVTSNFSFSHSVFNPFREHSAISKTLREKEKLLVTSNFSFSHSVFNPFREHSAISIKF